MPVKAGVIRAVDRTTRRGAAETFTGVVFQDPVLTAEAKAYLNNLVLTNVHMQASESLVNQRVVEILGDITNKGNRVIRLAEVTCVFSDYNGRPVTREREAIIGGTVGAMPGPLAPGASKPFRLAFDDLPEEWNQALPGLVIAQIQFE